MYTIRLKRNEERRVALGHPWIFSNEITDSIRHITPGDTVEVLDSRGRFVGRGYANPHSLIAVRLLTRRPDEVIDEAFFRQRIEESLTLRALLLPRETSCRLVFGEGDFLPGLIVDRYGDSLVVQSLTAGMERWVETIADILERLLAPRAIVLRNDSAVRELEGLPREKRVMRGEVTGPFEAREDDLVFTIDALEGQKTGFFLDQKENRRALRTYCRGMRVLDCFSYVGAWALNAARGGATEVIGLDSSAWAVKSAEENAGLNGLGDVCRFEKADVFDALRDLVGTGERFGCVVLDPPAFVKSRGKIQEGIRGYREINQRGMRLVEAGGYLVTASCSYHVDRNAFLGIIAQAAADAGRRVRLIEYRSQGKDHPVHPAVPETEYLKCAFLQVI